MPRKSEVIIVVYTGLVIVLNVFFNIITGARSMLFLLNKTP